MAQVTGDGAVSELARRLCVCSRSGEHSDQGRVSLSLLLAPRCPSPQPLPHRSPRAGWEACGLCLGLPPTLPTPQGRF